MALHARRGGVLSSGLSTVSAAVGRDVPLGREVSDPIRIAVVGAGAIAQVAHLPSLRRLPGVEVAAIWRQRSEQGAGPGRSVRRQGDVRRHRRGPEVRHADAVAICTPTTYNEIHVVSALAAGVHVLCERPLASPSRGSERVLQASEKYGKRVMVGMNHRFRSDVQAVRGFPGRGDIGLLQAIRGGWYTFQPSRQVIGWRLRRQEAGGGAFSTWACSCSTWACGSRAGPRRSALPRIPSVNRKTAWKTLATALVVCENGVSLSIDVTGGTWGKPSASGSTWWGRKGRPAFSRCASSRRYTAT